MIFRVPNERERPSATSRMRAEDNRMAAIRRGGAAPDRRRKKGRRAEEELRR
jgi:hypothetical protein